MALSGLSTKKRGWVEEKEKNGDDDCSRADECEKPAPSALCFFFRGLVFKLLFEDLCQGAPATRRRRPSESETRKRKKKEKKSSKKSMDSSTTTAVDRRVVSFLFSSPVCRLLRAAAAARVSATALSLCLCCRRRKRTLQLRRLHTHAREERKRIGICGELRSAPSGQQNVVPLAHSSSSFHLLFCERESPLASPLPFLSLFFREKERQKESKDSRARVPLSS